MGHSHACLSHVFLSHACLTEALHLYLYLQAAPSCAGAGGEEEGQAGPGAGEPQQQHMLLNGAALENLEVMENAEGALRGRGRGRVCLCVVVGGNVCVCVCEWWGGWEGRRGKGECGSAGVHMYPCMP